MWTPTLSGLESQDALTGPKGVLKKGLLQKHVCGGLGDREESVDSLSLYVHP